MLILAKIRYLYPYTLPFAAQFCAATGAKRVELHSRSLRTCGAAIGFSISRSADGRKVAPFALRATSQTLCECVWKLRTFAARMCRRSAVDLHNLQSDLHRPARMCLRRRCCDTCAACDIQVSHRSAADMCRRTYGRAGLRQICADLLQISRGLRSIRAANVRNFHTHSQSVCDFSPQTTCGATSRPSQTSRSENPITAESLQWR